MKDAVVGLVESAMALSGFNYSKVASMIQKDGKPMSRQSFFKMVKHGSLRLSVFLEALDVMGLELTIRKK